MRLCTGTWIEGAKERCAYVCNCVYMYILYILFVYIYIYILHTYEYILHTYKYILHTYKYILHTHIYIYETRFCFFSTVYIYMYRHIFGGWAGSCLNPVTVGKTILSILLGPFVNLHSPLLQCLIIIG